MVTTFPAPPPAELVARTRLHTAAGRLLLADAARDHTPILQRMAGTEPGAWTPEQTSYAAELFAQLWPQLLAAGVDPVLLPRPEQLAPEVVVAERTPEPFRYAHTADALRGIPVSELSAVGTGGQERFDACELSSVYDLLMHVPLRYVDRSTSTPVCRLIVGETATVIAKVVSTTVENLPQGGRLARIVVADGTGTLSVSFFNQAWQASRFTEGDEVIALGKVGSYTASRSGRTFLTMTNTLLDRIGDTTARILPIYPQSPKAGLTTWQIHRAAGEAVSRIGELLDPVPEATLTERGLMGRTQAYRLVHRPAKAGDEVHARQRLAYDELLRMQAALLMRKHRHRSLPGVEHTPTGALTAALLRGLPFPLTAGQRHALEEIETDLRQPTPMHRLLQGDVGAGKTLVLLHALLQAVESGHQGVLMAPTEVLATQHHREVTRRLAGLTHPDGRPLRVAALTNRVKTRARRELLEALAAGDIDIVVGTHALLSDDVVFASLGLVVVDEQHRFGVQQRAALREKTPGRAPDMLVATATPIPRTAAMTVFGDLDVTVLPDMPAGRTPVSTRWETAAPEDVLDSPACEPWPLVRAEVVTGRQAFVVCPMVEDSETQSALSATATRDRLTHGALRGLRVGLVHGKQKPDDREAVMAAFRDGTLDVLVATTVIEVGVDIPNTTVIIVMDADRFGLAQLHQLRGRVGRGKSPGHCVLVSSSDSPEASARLEALCSTTSGFELAETDLRLRGEGSILGARQAGMSDLRVASLRHDRDLVAAARADARTLLAEDPDLTLKPELRAEVHAALGPDAEEWLARS